MVTRTGKKDLHWAETEALKRKQTAHKNAIKRKIEKALTAKKHVMVFAGKLYVLYKHLDADSSPASGWSASQLEYDLHSAGFNAVVTHGPGNFDWDVWVGRK